MPVGAARREAEVSAEAPRTGARSIVQPTAKRKNAETTAKACRPRRTTVNAGTLTNLPALALDISITTQSSGNDGRALGSVRMLRTSS